MKYKIVLNKTDESYSVSCPGLPGVDYTGIISSF